MHVDAGCYNQTPHRRPQDPIDMPANATSSWLPRVLFESALIVVSILVALGLDEWREDRQDEETVQLALSNFASELRQNQERVDDAAPFNRGLRSVLRNHYQDEDIESVEEFVNMVGSYAPVVLQSTAWETALATGSLAKMEYYLVSALSLTYSLQNRYQLLSRSGMADLTSPQNLSEDKLNLAIYNSIRYLDDITSMEEELGVIYNEAFTVLQTARTNLIDGANRQSHMEARETSQ